MFFAILAVLVGLWVWRIVSIPLDHPPVLELPTNVDTVGDYVDVGKPLAAQKIFSGSKDYLRDLDKNRLTTVVVTGDVIPARSVNFMQTKNGFDWAAKRVGGVVSDGEVTFVNLETPIIEKCPMTNEGMVFCGSNKNIKVLTDLGADIVGLGNNHAGNHGADGVLETANLLKQKGIDVVGMEDSNLVVKDINGIKFGFLAFNDISKPQPEVADAIDEEVKQAIAEAKRRADVAIVQFHWGGEYRAQPDSRQVELGHLAIDSGADLVIGNHPHWIQPIEIYKGKLITYAHGNLIFDQEWSEKTKLGVVGKYYFLGKDLVDVEYLPVRIENYGQPYFLEGEAKVRVLDGMRQESEKLKI